LAVPAHTTFFQRALHRILVYPIVHDHAQMVACHPGALHKGAGFQDRETGQKLIDSHAAALTTT
jgi:hypothetical protein